VEEQAAKNKAVASCHTDDITALCLSPDRTQVASGQVGLAPTVFVWNSETAELQHSIKLPKGSRAVTAIGFSADASLLSCSDLSNDHNVYVYKLSENKPPQLLNSEKGGPDKILHLCWNQDVKNPEFCSVGSNHVRFWNPNSNGKNMFKKGINGVKNSAQSGKLNYACVAFAANG
jgi:WD40 repeat protein